MKRLGVLKEQVQYFPFQSIDGSSLGRQGRYHDDDTQYRTG